MQQVVDLQNAPTFQSLGVDLVSIGIDPLTELTPAAKEWNITTPLLSDSDHKVSQAYGVLQWAMPSGEPGHTFVLVGRDGSVKWIQDYGAPQNSGRMYVPLEELLPQIKAHL